MTAFMPTGIDTPPDLLDDISAAGFEIVTVALESVDQFTNLLAEIERHGLWDSENYALTEKNALLMVTPFGFRYIASRSDFLAWLPKVEEVRFE